MLTQAEHDAKHPGKICGKCPIEVEHRELISTMGIAAVNTPIKGLMFAILANIVFIGVIILAVMFL